MKKTKNKLLSQRDRKVLELCISLFSIYVLFQILPFILTITLVAINSHIPELIFSYMVVCFTLVLNVGYLFRVVFRAVPIIIKEDRKRK